LHQEYRGQYQWQRLRTVLFFLMNFPYCDAHVFFLVSFVGCLVARMGGFSIHPQTHGHLESNTQILQESRTNRAYHILFCVLHL
jgi:hypothetical protein